MRKLLVIVLCGITLGAAAPAMAQGPTQGAYSGPGASQLSQAPTATQTSGSLPFTGLNVGALSVAAALMLGAGLVLRRSTGRTHPE